MPWLAIRPSITKLCFFFSGYMLCCTVGSFVTIINLLLNFLRYRFHFSTLNWLQLGGKKPVHFLYATHSSMKAWKITIFPCYRLWWLSLLLGKGITAKQKYPQNLSRKRTLDRSLAWEQQGSLPPLIHWFLHSKSLNKHLLMICYQSRLLSSTLFLSYLLSFFVFL